MRYKILVVDDEKHILSMIKDYLEIIGYSVYTCENGQQALERLAIQPDLILLDINMPTIDGLEVCKRIRKHVSIPIIFLTARIGEQDRVNGFQVGGDDYILKPFSLEKLGARVMAHLRREERTRGKSQVKMSDEMVINYSERTVMIYDQLLTLTKTEFDIIELLSMHKGQVFDKETIYEKLWGFDKDGNSSIITEHIRRIRTKMKKHYEKEVIETVWGVGYKWS